MTTIAIAGAVHFTDFEKLFGLIINAKATYIRSSCSATSNKRILEFGKRNNIPVQFVDLESSSQGRKRGCARAIKDRNTQLLKDTDCVVVCWEGLNGLNLSLVGEARKKGIPVKTFAS